MQRQLLAGLEQSIHPVPGAQLLDLDIEPAGDAVERITRLYGVGAWPIASRRAAGRGVAGKVGSTGGGDDQLLTDIDQVALQVVGLTQCFDAGAVLAGNGRQVVTAAHRVGAEGHALAGGPTGQGGAELFGLRDGYGWRGVATRCLNAGFR